MAGGKLQEGIYIESGVPTPGFFSLILLNATANATAVDVGKLLGSLWELYDNLKKGRVGDLKGAQGLHSGDLKVLLGFGSRAFGLAGRPADAAALPNAMVHGFDAPLQDGGGPVTEGAGINYEPDVKANAADAAFVLQFTAKTPLAVERAVVETWKLLRDQDPAALAIQAVYTGTKRDDRRSWIDFFDGLSNILSTDRPKVVTIPTPTTPPDPTITWMPPAQDEWTGGGSYLAFMRLYIDLGVWRALDTPTQEVLVGREKVSGLPLSAPGLTFPAHKRDAKPPRDADPGRFDQVVRLDPAISASHIQRSNQHDLIPGGPANPRNHRIYRQGYPFLEPLGVPPGFRVGLNFVSFQSMPATMIGMLGQVTWLGNTNFAGDGSVVLITARAAGAFLVPPCEDAPPAGETAERFPGDRALTGGLPPAP